MHNMTPHSELKTSFSSDSDTSQSSSSTGGSNTGTACNSPLLTSSNNMGAAGPGRFIVKLSPHFLALTLLIAASFALSVGTVSHTILLLVRGNSHQNVSPAPPTADAIRHALIDVDETKAVQQQEAAGSTEQNNNSLHVYNSKETIDQRQDSATAAAVAGHPLPAGHHLKVDIKNVDANFLNSKDRLAQAVVDLMADSERTFLSYHCHSLVPMGVTCAGILAKSHVTIHTWPTDGVIAIDFFASGEDLLIPFVPVVKKLFAIPNEGAVEDSEAFEPMMLWSHDLRGFRKGFSPDYKEHENPLEQDLGDDLLRKLGLDWKDVVVSEETDFQHVDIYEVIEPQISSLASYKKSLSDTDSYEYQHPEMYRPDKVLFLDGVLQSSLYGEAAYHEALVHPAMLAHPNPERVAIIGGGEGATLREVLKHNTVADVMMVEIDQELVELCEEHLSEWSDCSDIVGSDADSCFDDSKASVEFMDAFAWFIDHFGEDKRDEIDEEEQFDVIIMDALDPDQFVAIVGSLYKDGLFVESLFRGLSKDGVFVVQLGESSSIDDPSAEMGSDIDKANMMKSLENAGFESMHLYDEGHSKFDAPWSYLICFKNSQSRASWYKSSTEFDIQLHNRLYRTKSGKPILHYFDAPTMSSYQMPPKAEETVYCRGVNNREACKWEVGMHPDIVNIPASHLEARKSEVAEFAGRGLFAAQDIPSGSCLAMDKSVTNFHVSPSAWSIITRLQTWANQNRANFASVENKISTVSTFTTGYGYGTTRMGKTQYTVDPWITTFCNHGCNGTWSYGFGSDEFTEMNVDLDKAPAALFQAVEVWSPVFERHVRQAVGTGDETMRDIKKGEEILCNYLSFVADPDDWKIDVTSLRSQCTGESVGEITRAENNGRISGN